MLALKDLLLKLSELEDMLMQMVFTGVAGRGVRMCTEGKDGLSESFFSNRVESLNLESGKIRALRAVRGRQALEW